MITEDTRLGPLLRTRREALGLSLEDIEAAIRIRAQYVLALESDEWQRLPGEVVGRGFLRNYAEFLKLDGNELKRYRHSETLAHLNQEWPNTSAGTQMPPQRDMDYRPLEAQQAGEFFLTGPNRTGAWRRFLLFVLLLIAIGLVTAAFFTDLYSGFEVGPELTDLQADVTGWVKNTYSQLSVDPRAMFPNPQNDDGEASSANVQIVEVAAPTLTLQTTPVNTPVATFTPVPAAGESSPAEPTPLPVGDGLAPAECIEEGMQITYPLGGQTINGNVHLTGTAAVSDQWYYKLEYRIVAGVGQAQRQAFTYFDGYMVTVTDGLLGELNTVSLSNGTYALRLTVVQRQEAEPLICELNVQVQN